MKRHKEKLIASFFLNKDRQKKYKKQCIKNPFESNIFFQLNNIKLFIFQTQKICG